MKIYEFKAFPGPRRVRMFLAEKSVDDISFEQINVPEGEHREAAFLAKNPSGTVPTLELDDGRHISESVAICRYFEEQNPAFPLMGETPEEKAEIEMWHRRIEQTLYDSIATYFHHGTPGLGALELYQNEEWGEKNLERFLDAMGRLDDRLAEHTFICGEKFSIVDITAFCGLYFASLVNIQIPDAHMNLKRWHADISGRPSAAA